MVDRMQGIGSGLGVQAEEIKEKALEFAATAKEKFTGGAETIKAYIVKEPTRALGIALGMGVVLGWLIKRR